MAEVIEHIESRISYECVILHLRKYYHICRNVNIFTASIPMVTKFGRVVNYNEGLLPIKSYNPLTTWSSEVTWQTKANIFPLL